MSVAAVVFDLYGTLLTIESMRAHAADAGAAEPDAFVADWRRKQLEYAFLSSLAQAYRDFDELTALALEHTCAQRRVALDGVRRSALVEAWRAMPAFGDVAPALGALAARGIPLAVLTNGTLVSANAALERAGIRALLADVLSVDAVRAYKPDPRVYALVTQRFGCAPGEIVFVSSNAWDAWGAARFGFRVAWCNRAGNAAESLVPAPEVTLAGLHELEAFVAGAMEGRASGTPSKGDAMTEDRTNAAGDSAVAEPALTQKNSETIRGEESLAADGDTGTRPKTGVSPTSYGAAGGTTDATEEGGDGTGI